MTLTPFLLGKYELTQAQWARLTRGERPSYVQRDLMAGAALEVDMLPVEQVSALQCDAVLARHGLVLPTEAQWEFACRVGTATPWSCGVDPAALLRHGNCSGDDQDLRLPGRIATRGDGFELPAPVGTFLPNGFGLYDMHGNVSEWCRDYFGPYEGFPARAGDGLRAPVDPAGEHFRRRITRGGSFGHSVVAARSSDRNNRDPRAVESYLGLRAARAVLRAQ